SRRDRHPEIVATLPADRQAVLRNEPACPPVPGLLRSPRPPFGRCPANAASIRNPGRAKARQPKPTMPPAQAQPEPRRSTSTRKASLSENRRNIRNKTAGRSFFGLRVLKTKLGCESLSSVRLFSERPIVGDSKT